jgi:signal transduction histidine kinase
MRARGVPSGLDRADFLLPAVIGAAAIAEVLIVDVPVLAGIVLTVLACVLLVGRRRMPLVFGTGAVMVLMLQEPFGVDESRLAVPMAILFLGCFALGRDVDGWSGLWGIGLVNTTLYVVAQSWPHPTDVVWGLSLTLGPWIVGRIVRDHARLNEVLAEQARQLVAEQAMVSERAVADERRRIARELHDIVAHSLSVMVVQAGAAYDLVRRDPGAAERALTEIQNAGRSALSETGRLLHVLRDDLESELAPPPAAADLPRLVEGFRSSGLDVELAVEGATEGLPAGVDLSVYRIVQEGLTNALKHGPEETVRVRYRRGPHGVDLDLHSGARPAARGPASNGRGLIGMRERVAVFGGRLEAAPTADGGFLVRAHLPVPLT